MSKLAVELSGYVDCGMKDLALKLSGEILDNERISPSEFIGVIRALGVCSDMEEWTARIEAAYRRQSAKFRDMVRESMVAFYNCTKDWKKAARFIRLRTLHDPHDLVFAMGVLLELDQLDKAKHVFVKCYRLLDEPMPSFGQYLLLEACASYFTRIGEWEQAIHLWRFAPLQDAFARRALVDIAEMYAARALMEARKGLAVLKETRKQLDPENEIVLPGNDDSMNDDWEKELLKLSGALEEIVPQERWKELGIAKLN
jgi:hypothetical protein